MWILCRKQLFNFSLKFHFSYNICITIVVMYVLTHILYTLSVMVDWSSFWIFELCSFIRFSVDFDMFCTTKGNYSRSLCLRKQNSELISTHLYAHHVFYSLKLIGACFLIIGRNNWYHMAGGLLNIANLFYLCKICFIWVLQKKFSSEFGKHRYLICLTYLKVHSFFFVI